MSTLLWVLIILLIVGAFPAHTYGGATFSGGLGLIILIFLVLLLTGHIQ